MSTNPSTYPSILAPFEFNASSSDVVDDVNKKLEDTKKRNTELANNIKKFAELETLNLKFQSLQDEFGKLTKENESLKETNEKITRLRKRYQIDSREATKLKRENIELTEIKKTTDEAISCEERLLTKCIANDIHLLIIQEKWEEMGYKMKATMKNQLNKELEELRATHKKMTEEKRMANKELESLQQQLAEENKKYEANRRNHEALINKTEEEETRKHIAVISELEAKYVADMIAKENTIEELNAELHKKKNSENQILVVGVTLIEDQQLAAQRGLGEVEARLLQQKEYNTDRYAAYYKLQQEHADLQRQQRESATMIKRLTAETLDQ